MIGSTIYVMYLNYTVFLPFETVLLMFGDEDSEEDCDELFLVSDGFPELVVSVP